MKIYQVYGVNGKIEEIISAVDNVDAVAKANRAGFPLPCLVEVQEDKSPTIAFIIERKTQLELFLARMITGHIRKFEAVTGVPVCMIHVPVINERGEGDNCIEVELHLDINHVVIPGE